jgi:hypothetical protein
MAAMDVVVPPIGASGNWCLLEWVVRRTCDGEASGSAGKRGRGRIRSRE